MNIEKSLVERIGPAGAKLHSARSRNDQIALDLKMYLRDQCDILDELLTGVAEGLRPAGQEIPRPASCRAIPICSGPSRC